MHAYFLIFFVATSLVAAYLGYLKWFEIESVDEIHSIPVGESWNRELDPVDEIHAKKIGEPWNIFKGNYKKQYESTGEEVHKRSVFAENMKKVVIHNQKYKKGEKSYWLGMNHFSDLTAKEFKALYCGCIKMSITLTDTNCSTFLPLHNVVLPDTVDWRERGYVTPVKDQSPCGSCWAFSAVQSCKYDASKVVTKVSGYVHITSGCESALQQAVATIGPVSVHIDVSPSSFKHYSGGVYNDKRCSSTHLKHAVLVVGYGTHGGQDYWLVKNSWGQSWGEKGYMKMARNKGNMCGIASLPMYPLM